MDFHCHRSCVIRVIDKDTFYMILLHCNIIFIRRNIIFKASVYIIDHEFTYTN